MGKQEKPLKLNGKMDDLLAVALQPTAKQKLKAIMKKKRPKKEPKR